MAERGKRNIERMTEEVKDSNYESLQHVISNSRWNTEGLTCQIARETGSLMSGKGLVGLTIDEKAHLKKGTKSAGVSRQYAGVVGKVDNCQVGVYASLCVDKYATVVDHRLYLPEIWSNDKQRCKKAGIPLEKTEFKTKLQLAHEMIKEIIDWDVAFDFINGDGLYGHGCELMKAIEALNKKYVLDIHKNYTIYTEKPEIRIPEKQAGSRGRKPSKLRPNVKGIQVDEYKKSLSNSNFKKVRIRKTTKGWLEALIHVAQVWVWDEESQDTEPIKQTLIIRKPIHKKDKMKYSLSNIPIQEQTVEVFAFMQAQRFWIEKCFRDNSHDLGMSDYQVRTYRGWNNHMALTSLAMLFVTQQRINQKEYAPLLSYNDVRQLLVEKLANNGKNIELKIEQTIKRQLQRQRDIMRYYKTE